MDSPGNESHKLPLKQVAQLQPFQGRNLGERLVHVGVELGADVFAREAHSAAAPALRIHARRVSAIRSEARHLPPDSSSMERAYWVKPSSSVLGKCPCFFNLWMAETLKPCFSAIGRNPICCIASVTSAIPPFYYTEREGASATTSEGSGLHIRCQTPDVSSDPLKV